MGKVLHHIRERSYGAHAEMPSLKSLTFGSLAVSCALATASFAFYGVQVVYAALTFDGEGSLGHVGMFIAAGLFPLLAFFFGGCTYIAWRKLRHPPPPRRPPDEPV